MSATATAPTASSSIYRVGDRVTFDGVPFTVVAAGTPYADLHGRNVQTITVARDDMPALRYMIGTTHSKLGRTAVA